MRRPLFLLFLFSLLSASPFAQQAIPTADEVMKEAVTLAAKDNKKVFIIFHASWCGWCRKMDASMNDASCKQLFDDNFIIRHLTVYESPGKKHLENPGAEELNKKFGGDGQGLPYWLIFDDKGDLLADSKMKKPGKEKEGDNTGCPASKEEVGYLIEVLKSVTALTPEELETINTRFRKNEL